MTALDYMEKQLQKHRSLADIAEKLNREYTWVTTVHGRAVKHVQEILEGENVLRQNKRT